MTEEELRKLRPTFPWTTSLHTVPHRQGGVVVVIDKYGTEVPLFTITRFVEYMTTRMSHAPVTPDQPKETANA